MTEALNFIRGNREKYLQELNALLSIPSISSDPNRQEDTAACAQHVAELLRKSGIKEVTVVPTAGHPVVFGNHIVDPKLPTALIYGHYDVQPVDPLELWEQDPFKAHIKNDRIIARGSADDKGQILMHCKAIEALNHSPRGIPLNLKIIFEGEEEIGSPNLVKFLSDHRAELKADVALVSDTGMWGEGIPAITYGLRGLAYLELELTGPNRDLHSGTYGGVVANPAEILARLLAGVKDAKGRIQIPGFYDKVRTLSESERTELNKVPFDIVEYRRDLGVAELWGEEPYNPIERAWIRPTFEINGIYGGFTGVGAKTVLPSKAAAKISMRLVPDQDPAEIAALVEQYFRTEAPKSVQVKLTRHHGGKPLVVPLDNPFMSAAALSLKEAFGTEPLFIREGGSIPICADFKELLGLDTILVGFALPDARTHSPNENLHLPSFFIGIESLVRMYCHFAENKPE